MTPFWQDDHLTLYGGDCREVLATLPAESVHCVVTSPPYWGLRDYGVGGQLGLEPTPEEYVANMVAVLREVRRVLRADGTLWLNLGDSYWNGGAEKRDGGHGFVDGGKPKLEAAKGALLQAKSTTEMGLKPKDLVGIPWMVARALQAPFYTGKIRDERDRAWLAGWLDGEGTISFVERNRGEDHTPTHDARVFVTNTDREPLDYFAAISGGHVYHHDGERPGRYGSRPCYRWQMGTHDAALLLRELYPYLRTKRRQAALVWTLYTTLRHKNGHARTPDAVVARRREIADMIRSLNAGGEVTLPPWAEEPPSATEPGWYLRSDIIWSKPNPMPESVTDRPTKAHEYLFLLSKSPRYYYDAEAVREPHDDTEWSRKGAIGGRVQATMNPIERSGDIERGRALTPGERFYNPAGRNLRSVWTIATEPYPGAHFATFPRKLVEPCVKAGTSERGVCPECGAPWVRVVEIERPASEAIRVRAGDGARPGPMQSTPGVAHTAANFAPRIATTGWRPSCGCKDNAPPVREGVQTPSAHGGRAAQAYQPVPAVVLDPFAGSGTTLLVAQALGRRGIGIDLSPDYLKQALARNAQTPLGLVG